MRKLSIILIFLLSCSSSSPEPQPEGGLGDAVNETPGLQYVLFTDFCSDPDDEQSLARLFHYPEITPGFVMVDNGHGCRDKFLSWVDTYAQDYPKLAPHGARTPEYWKSITFHSHNDTRSSDFKDIKDRNDCEGEERFIQWMGSHNDFVEVWVWGTATTLAKALYKSPTLRSRLRVISIGSWNRRQDQSAHDFLWSIRTELAGYLNMETTFRGMYCGYDSKPFVDWAAGQSQLGKRLKQVSQGINTGAGTLKEGDTPTFLFSLGILQGKCSWDTPRKRECWAGEFREISSSVWSDVRDNESCGYDGAGTLRRHQKEIEDSFRFRLTR